MISAVSRLALPRASSVFSASRMLSSTAAIKGPNSIFVGNLDFYVDEGKLRSHFGNSGQIENINLVRDHATGQCRGFAFIDFENFEGMQNALSLEGSILDGRNIRVNPSENKPRGGSVGGFERGTNRRSATSSDRVPNPKAYMITNLPENITLPQLLQSFVKFGPLRSVAIHYDTRTGAHKQSGTVTFLEESDAKAALEAAETTSDQDPIFTLETGDEVHIRHALHRVQTNNGQMED